MKKTSIAATLFAGAFLLGPVMSAAHTMDVDDTMLRMAGEFELGNGETHTIAHHKTDKEYRICVKNVRTAVPLKVMYDGKESIVAAGNCADFEAMNIKITPATKLDKDIVLIGKYHRLNTNK